MAGHDAPAETQMQDLRVSFFIMPTEMLKSLHDEFASLAGEKIARSILFRCGFRGGESVTKRMGLSCDNGMGIGDMLLSLWIEIGLGRLRVLEETADEILIESEDSTESIAMGKTGKAECDMTRGWLSGIVSMLTGKRFYCYEEKCASKGDKTCVYRVTVKEQYKYS